MLMNVKYICFIIILLYLVEPLKSQTRKVELDLITEKTGDSVLLRWAPKNYKSWQWSKNKGWVIERACLSDTTPSGVLQYRQLSTGYTHRPKEQWRSLVEKSDATAIAAQLMFGESFEISADASLDLMMTKYKEDQMRFAFAMTSADRDYNTARMMGLGFTDQSPENCQVLIYRIYAAGQDSVMASDTAYSVINRNDPDRKIKIYSIKQKVSDTAVLLYWPRVPFGQTYSFFDIRRSVDGQHFSAMHQTPYVSLENTDFSKEYFHFNDRLVSGTDSVYYIIRGITPFGTYGPWSDTIVVDIPSPLVQPDRLSYVTHDTENTVMLRWEYPGRFQSYLEGFRVYQSGSLTAPLEKPITVTPDKRQVKLQLETTETYVMVEARTRGKKRSMSSPVFIQLSDSIPPEAPNGLTGAIDTTGMMHLHWKKPAAIDLYGFKVYSTHDPNAEFSQLITGFLYDTVWKKQFALKHLNRYVYIKLKAYDVRFNHSRFSRVLKLALPDTIPPSPPVFFRPLIEKNQVHFKWKPSGSGDVAHYIIIGHNEKQNIQDTLVLEDSNANEFHMQAAKNQNYNVALAATDSSGNVAYARNRFQVNLKNLHQQNRKPVLEAEANYRSGTIDLSWKGGANSTKTLIYRRTENGPMRLHKTLHGHQTRFSDKQVSVGAHYIYRVQMENTQHTRSQMSNEISLKF